MTTPIDWKPSTIPGNGGGGPPHPPSRDFETTQWALVRTAGDPTHEEASIALDDLCRIYWLPLYVFLCRRGETPDDAADLTQAFLADFIERKQFSRANRDHGRLRSYLIVSMENFLRNARRRRNAQKRGGGSVWIVFDHPDPQEKHLVAGGTAESPEQAYHRQWARSLLDWTVQRLQMEWRAAGRGLLCEEFLTHLWEDFTSVPYGELCARFDITPVNLRVTFHRFRCRYRDILRQAIRETVRSDLEVDDEIRFLMSVVSQ